MNALGKGYDFRLTRTQRLCSVVAEWWAPGILLCIILLGLIPAWVQHPFITASFGLVLLFFFRGLVFGMLSLFSDGKTHVEIEDRGVGFGRDEANWWIFTDGIKQIRKNRWGTTSIRHHNGTYVDIPTALLSPEDHQKLEAGMNKYHEFWRSHKVPKESPTSRSSQRRPEHSL